MYVPVPIVSVLWIRIRSDQKLFAGWGYRMIKFGSKKLLAPIISTAHLITINVLVLEIWCGFMKSTLPNYLMGPVFGF
jgi:hypothetical protein